MFQQRHRTENEHAGFALEVAELFHEAYLGFLLNGFVSRAVLAYAECVVSRCT